MQDLITRVPPHSYEAEQEVLAGCLMGPDLLACAIDALSPADFFATRHQLIFAAILTLAKRNEDVTLVTIQDALGDRLLEAGGVGYLVDLHDGRTLASQYGSNLAIVAEKALRRRAIAAASETLDEAYNAEVDDPVGRAQSRFMGLAVERRGESCVSFAQVVENEYGRTFDLMERRNRGEHLDVRAFTFGETLGQLDEMIVPTPGDLILVGARPSTGKTALGLQIAAEVAREKPVLFFSLEMQKEAIARRYIALLTGISVHRQKTGFVTREEADLIAQVQASAQFLNMEIDDRPRLSIAQMQATALRREHIRGEKWGLVVTDHLAEVKADNPKASGHEKMSQIASDHKRMLRENGWAGLALMQLRRSPNGQEDKRPTDQDLRESGTLEQVADVIVLIHRLKEERKKATSAATLIVEKNRDGAVGDVQALFTGDRMRFECPTMRWAT